ncbi:MAG TPA: DNA repair protein RecN [Anaerolineales bacterium]|nr:DNA repair protein RecN [Anaerolineales bacterium]
MLSELSISNFAIIDSLDLTFAPGFNVLTGETGAGKSIIIDAVSLLLGGRSDATMVRSGAEAARLEGVFALDSETRAAVQPILEREELQSDDGDAALTLAREIRREGRNVCRVNGRTVSLAILKEIGQCLVDIHGQSEHLSLLRVREHLFLLDRYAGLDDQRAELSAVVRELNNVRVELDDLIRAERDAARRIDLLNFQINEITAAKLKPGEDKTLLEERTRLANAEKLAALVDEAIQAAAEGDEASGAPAATDLLGHAARALNSLAKIDPALEAHRDTAQSLGEQLAELARDLRGYRESIEFNPKRLDQVEERIDLIKSLQRKYGAAIEDVLAFGENAARDLEAITHAGERIEQLRKQEESLLKKIGKLGQALSKARRDAGERLAQGIEAELGDLRMDGARFGVDIQWEEADDGAILNGEKRVAFDSAGIDRIEFLIAPNPGEGFKPLVKIASGGETARLMLALKGVLARADRTPTLIFDEIDQGIGGRVGAVVGRKLWGLANAHQVLCITHLPQLAGFGDAHFRVVKQVNGDRTTTDVTPLDSESRIEEIAQMLGTEGAATRQSAIELLKMVNTEKTQQR